MSHTYRRGEARIAYDREGFSGDPVALVHGAWEDRSSWDRVLPGLAVAFQALSYDRRGHGDSSPAAEGGAVAADAGDLADLLEASELFPAHLVAAGYGAAPALLLAAERPELVRSVVVHDPSFLALLPGSGAGEGAVRRKIDRAVERARDGDGEGAAQAYLEAAGSPDEQGPLLDASERSRLTRNAARAARELADPRATAPDLDPLRLLALPVLVTTGASSPAWFGEVAERLAEALPNSTHLRLGEGGHFVYRTDPDLFVGVIGSFLLERNVPPT